MRKLFLASILAAASLSASNLFAIPKYYELGGGSVNALSNDPGLVVHTSVNPGVAGTSFTLNDGNSSTFNFFDIWTDETWVNSGEDTVPHAISATLNFVDPLTGATVNGITVGGSLLFGLAQWGEVQWNGPTTITLTGDRVFDVSLSNEIFNLGYFGVGEGQGHGATVEATITQITSEAAEAAIATVPDHDGSTAMLFGASLAGLTLIARKRVKAVVSH